MTRQQMRAALTTLFTSHHGTPQVQPAYKTKPNELKEHKGVNNDSTHTAAHSNWGYLPLSEAFKTCRSYLLLRHHLIQRFALLLFHTATMYSEKPLQPHHLQLLV